MTIAEKTIGKITYIVNADKKSNYYLNKSNDIVIADECYILKQINLLKLANKKGTFVENLKAITDNQKRYLNNCDIKFIDKNYESIKSGGIVTMLKNKGII